jgi:hypothetical protein
VNDMRGKFYVTYQEPGGRAINLFARRGRSEENRVVTYEWADLWSLLVQESMQNPSATIRAYRVGGDNRRSLFAEFKKGESKRRSGRDAGKNKRTVHLPGKAGLSKIRLLAKKAAECRLKGMIERASWFEDKLEILMVGAEKGGWGEEAYEAEMDGRVAAREAIGRGRDPGKRVPYQSYILERTVLNLREGKIASRKPLRGVYRSLAEAKHAALTESRKDRRAFFAVLNRNGREISIYHQGQAVR